MGEKLIIYPLPTHLFGQRRRNCCNSFIHNCDHFDFVLRLRNYTGYAAECFRHRRQRRGGKHDNRSAVARSVQRRGFKKLHPYGRTGSIIYPFGRVRTRNFVPDAFTAVRHNRRSRLPLS